MHLSSSIPLTSALLATLTSGQVTTSTPNHDLDPTPSDTFDVSSWFAALGSAISAEGLTTIDVSALTGIGSLPTDTAPGMGSPAPTPTATTATGASHGSAGSSSGGGNGGNGAKSASSHGAAAPTGVVAGGALAAVGVAALAILL